MGCGVKRPGLLLRNAAALFSTDSYMFVPGWNGASQNENAFEIEKGIMG
jgi:hypothetical protein